MGLKYYLNLFKRDSNIEAIKLRYYLNIFVLLVYMVFVAVFFSLRNTDIILSSVFGILALIGLIGYLILDRTFVKLVNRLIADEPLNDDDETDRAFQAYRTGYADFYKKAKSFAGKTFFLTILWAAALILVFPVMIAVNLLGFTDLAEQIYRIFSILISVYWGVVIIIGIFLSKKGVWYQEYLNEIDIINTYKAEKSDGGVKYKILEDKKQNQQLDYMLPDADLRKKYSKLQKMNLLAAILFGCILGAGIAVPNMLLANGQDTLAYILLAVILGGGMSIWIALLIVVSYLQKKVMIRQCVRLNASETVNALCIKLHALRTPFMRRWNILFVVYILGALLSNILFAGITSGIIKSDSYGWVFSLLFLVEFIGTFVLYFKAYGKLRQKMIKIENEIDKVKPQSNAR